MTSLWDDIGEELGSTNVTPIRDDMPEWAPYDEHVEALAPLPGRLSFADIKGKRAPLRRFIIDGWIVRGSAGLLSGLEGVGKSLLGQQMATCASVGVAFLGMPIAHTNAVYISCEDDLEELWRRQEAINSALGITMEELEGKLELISWKGEIGNELATFDAGGRLIVQNRYRQLETFCDEFKPGLVFLDNAAHFFPGNENARHDVAAFLGLVEQLSIRIDGAVILLAHPNKQFSQGNTAGNEYSGSTGWSAHVRNRLFLNYRAEADDGTPIDDDDRTLRKSKANYGKRGEEVHFRWHQWAFHVEGEVHDQSAEARKNAEAASDNDIFLRCLDLRNSQKRAVSEKKRGGNYAPKEFAEMVESKGIGRPRLERAMDRLFRIGAIERGYLWVYSGEGKAAHGLRRTEKSATPNGSERLNSNRSDRSEAVENQSDRLIAGTVRGESGETEQNQSDRLSERSPKTSERFTLHTPPHTPPARAHAPTREGVALGSALAREDLEGDPPQDERDDDYTPIDWGDE
jgi:RecA-family ATPase